MKATTIRIPIPATGRDVLNVQHPGWWAQVDRPSFTLFEAEAEVEVEFCVYGDEVVARGKFLHLVPPGVTWDGSETFRMWWKIVYEPRI